MGEGFFGLGPWYWNLLGYSGIDLGFNFGFWEGKRPVSPPEGSSGWTFGLLVICNSDGEEGLFGFLRTFGDIWCWASLSGWYCWDKGYGVSLEDGLFCFSFSFSFGGTPEFGPILFGVVILCMKHGNEISFIYDKKTNNIFDFDYINFIFIFIYILVSFTVSIICPIIYSLNDLTNSIKMKRYGNYLIGYIFWSIAL